MRSRNDVFFREDFSLQQRTFFLKIFESPTNSPNLNALWYDFNYSQEGYVEVFEHYLYTFLDKNINTKLDRLRTIILDIL